MKQYLDLVGTILTKGTQKDAGREGMPGSRSYFGYQFRHNLAEGFPLLTTKKLSFKNIIVELLWFLKGDTNIKYLVDNGCNIWNEDQQNFVNKNNWTNEGSLGYQYPWLWRTWGKKERDWQPKPNFVKEVFEHELFPPIIRESKSKFVGNIIKTVEGYDYLIYDYNSKTNTYYIWFTHDGLCLEKKTSKNFKNVKYPYHKTVLGIACIGRPKGEPTINKKLYSTWRGMINRCYDKKNISYPLYGGKGVYVENRWLCFEYFVEDVKNLHNWEEKIKRWSKYTLEKDFGRGYVYSKDDCIWSNYNFSRLDRITHYTFKNIETKKEYTTNNFADFGRKIGKEKLVSSHMRKLIDGRLKSLGGWELMETKEFGEKPVDQVVDVIKGIKSNPLGRRHIISAWNPGTLNDMALNACHALVQFNCRPLTLQERELWLTGDTGAELLGSTDEAFGHLVLDKEGVPKFKLDCQMYQRSADTFLGVPYNIASYALLTHIIAKMCNMIPGDFIHTFGDAHIYDNHVTQMETQLMREVRPLPKLVIGGGDDYPWESPYDWETEDIGGLINQLALDIETKKGFWKQLFHLEGYNPHDRIDGELSTGLKK